MEHLCNTKHMQEILCQTVTGFYQCALTDPPRLIFAGQNLCSLLGCTVQDLCCDDIHAYLSFVHPSDRERYLFHIAALRKNAHVRSIEYRLQPTSGDVVWVKETMRSTHLSDGKFVGEAVLADITDIKKENETLRSLYETIPCGFLKFTCEKQPRVTYINEQLMRFLRIPKTRDGEIDYLSMYYDNVFLMVPMEARQTFAKALHRAAHDNIPVAGEMTVLRCDGTRAHFYGWIKKCTDDSGQSEFQAVCIDATAAYQAKVESETNRYLKALTDVYDSIFEYDLSANTVSCINSYASPMFHWLENIPMQMQDATEKWIDQTVVAQDRERVNAFFRAFFDKTLYATGDTPPRITYQATAPDGTVKTYVGIFLKISEVRSYYCCRCIPDNLPEEPIRQQSVLQKEQVQEMVQQFKDGIAAIEISDGAVTPLYASENVCNFFGYTKDEWYALMKVRTPLEMFVARSGIPYTSFTSFLSRGEAEFRYLDVQENQERCVQAICFPRSSLVSPRYVLLYRTQAVSQPEKPLMPEKTQEEKNVSIRTFGYFDVFVGGKPIAFRSQKSKELFALLVDRRGGFVSSEEAIGFLWEDEPVSSVTLARYRKVALRLKNILQEYGISDVMETVDGKRRIVMERVHCDLYDYLSGKPEYAQLFKGSYLSNYSWGEVTLGELLNAKQQ